MPRVVSSWLASVAAVVFMLGFTDLTYAEVGGSTQSEQRSPSSIPSSEPPAPFGGPIPRNDHGALHMAGDDLVYDAVGRRVIARDRVEIYHNHYMLTADEMVYDPDDNTLTARGNALLKEPNGNVVRRGSLETTADFRDAFIETLSLIGHDDSLISIRRTAQ